MKRPVPPKCRSTKPLFQMMNLLVSMLTVWWIWNIWNFWLQVGKLPCNVCNIKETVCQTQVNFFPMFYVTWVEGKSVITIFCQLMYDAVVMYYSVLYSTLLRSWIYYSSFDRVSQIMAVWRCFEERWLIVNYVVMYY